MGPFPIYADKPGEQRAQSSERANEIVVDQETKTRRVQNSTSCRHLPVEKDESEPERLMNESVW